MFLEACSAGRGVTAALMIAAFGGVTPWPDGALPAPALETVPGLPHHGKRDGGRHPIAAFDPGDHGLRRGRLGQIASYSRFIRSASEM
jgi:hypothetical protein